MALDLTIVRRIVEDLYLPAIDQVFGNEGVGATKRVLEGLKIFYQYYAPEMIGAMLFVLEPLREGESLATLIGTPDKEVEFKFLVHEDLSLDVDTPLIAGFQDGKLLLWRKKCDIETLSGQAIVYVYHKKKEFFIVSGVRKEIYNPDPTYPSAFSIPTFNEVVQALEDYKHRKIRHSTCEIFATAWHSDQRLYFKSKPEAIIRNSLVQHLRTVLHGATVLPEQNVDKSHPVDIRVTWMMASRVALIEIKWLGKSLNEKGNFIPYADARANEGAAQLVDYLEAHKSHATEQQIKGYLVIVDARRRGLQTTTTAIDCTNGYHYKDVEINFDPAFDLLRSDFETPIRMFAEPVCNHR